MVSAVITDWGWPAGDDLAVGEQVDGVAEQGGQAQVVEGGEDGDAEAGDEFEHFDLVADVEMVGGLVEDEMVGALGEGPGDQHPLFLATREGVEAAAGQVLAADPGDGLGGDGPIGVVVALERALVGGAADHHHLEDGEVELDGGLLGDHGHPAGRVLGRHGQQVGPVEQDPTGDRSVDPVDGLEDGGLAAAVGSEQSHEASVGHGDIDVGHDAPPGDVHRQAPHLQAHVAPAHWVAP